MPHVVVLATGGTISVAPLGRRWSRPSTTAPIGSSVVRQCRRRRHRRGARRAARRVLQPDARRPPHDRRGGGPPPGPAGRRRRRHHPRHRHPGGDGDPARSRPRRRRGRSCSPGRSASADVADTDGPRNLADADHGRRRTRSPRARGGRGVRRGGLRRPRRAQSRTPSTWRRSPGARAGSRRCSTAACTVHALPHRPVAIDAPGPPRSTPSGSMSSLAYPGAQTDVLLRAAAGGRRARHRARRHRGRQRAARHSPTRRRPRPGTGWWCACPPGSRPGRCCRSTATAAAPTSSPPAPSRSHCPRSQARIALALLLSTDLAPDQVATAARVECA